MACAGYDAVKCAAWDGYDTVGESKDDEKDSDEGAPTSLSTPQHLASTPRLYTSPQHLASTPRLNTSPQHLASLPAPSMRCAAGLCPWLATKARPVGAAAEVFVSRDSLFFVPNHFTVLIYCNFFLKLMFTPRLKTSPLHLASTP